MRSYVSRTTENCTRTLAPNKSVRSAFISSYDTFLIKGKNDGPVVSLFKVVSLVVPRQTRCLQPKFYLNRVLQQIKDSHLKSISKGFSYDP